jgi:hypothetical protein
MSGAGKQLARVGPSGDHSLLFPGHVFPEFKESDAMFAAERVSLWGLPLNLGVGLF